MNGNYLRRREAWLYYSSFFLPSITYPLANTFFTKKQLDTIERPTINAILSKTGFCNKMHRSIVYGPRELAGKQFKSLYVEQGVLSLKQIIGVTRKEGSAAQTSFIVLQ